MKNLMITSCHERIGKSSFTLALARRIVKEGYKVGYFKPIRASKDDQDALVAKEFLKMEEDEDTIAPVTISEWDYDLSKEEIERLIEKIKNAYETLNQKYEVLVVEGCKTMNYLATLGLSARELAKMLETEVLLLVSGSNDSQLDDLALGVSYFNDIDIELTGTVLSLVPLEVIEREKAIAETVTREWQIPLIGVIPDKSNLSAPTVEEIVSLLGAKYLCCEECKNKIVEDFQVGAMELDSALKFFRRSVNKAVIIGGDRPALALAAMETDTSMLILTGGIYPPSTVLARAQERKIPIVLVNWDTYTTVQYLATHKIRGLIRPNQEEKLIEWDKIMEELNVENLIARLNE